MANKDFDISFRAKWSAVIIEASRVDDGALPVYAYQVTEQFIPVNEVSKPYGLPDFTDSEAATLLHGSTVVDLLPAYNGVNLDLNELVMSPKVIYHRLFGDAEHPVAVQKGDSLLILVPR